MNDMDYRIMRRMRNGPVYARSLGPFAKRASVLCDAGLLKRVAPPEKIVRNMYALSDKGERLLEKHIADAAKTKS